MFRPVNVRWLGIEDISKEMVYVFLGILVCKYLVEKGNYQFAKKSTILLSSLVSIILFLFFYGTISIKIVSVLMIYVIMGVAVKLARNQIRTLEYIGSHTFTIYIYSWPIQAVIEMVMVVLINLPWFVTTIMMFICGLTIPLLMYAVYNKLFKRNKVIDGIMGI